MVGIGELRKKLAQKTYRIDKRYAYYEMKYSVRDFGISTPPELRYFMGVLGWCAKSVDTLADRLCFREFRADNFGLNDIYALNNPDVLFDSAMLSALISSCSFIYISPDEQGFPRLQVLDGAHATGIIDPITNLLTEGYAVLERDGQGKAKVEAYFTPEYTEIITAGEGSEVFDNPAPAPLLVPILFRPDARRPFGHSRISRAQMDTVGSAVRTIKRSEIAAEFYSYPQKYITGLAQDAEGLDRWKASMSAMMTFTVDDQGNAPKPGQFTQQSMQPHTEQLRMFASIFAAETGLTLDDLGFPSDNPSSSEAIKASHENLRLTAQKAQRTFGTGFLNAGYLAACLRDNFAYKRELLYLTKPVWEPIFTPDASAIAGIGDGIAKLNMAVPGYVNRDTIRDLTGIAPPEG